MKTTNYELFSFFPENRPISKGNIEQKKKSIQKIGYIEACPILVNENFQIIDGQHRFLALKELKMPIVYVIECINSHEAMIELNRNQQIWRLAEYVNHYAALGREEFIILRDMQNKYSKLGSTAIFSCFGIKSANHSKPIKLGEKLKINKNGEDVIKYLLRFNKLEFYKRRDFVNAIEFAFNNLNYENIEKLVRKQLQIPLMASRTAYLICFENILNHNVREANRISLSKIN